MDTFFNKLLDRYDKKIFLMIGASSGFALGVVFMAIFTYLIFR